MMQILQQACKLMVIVKATVALTCRSRYKEKVCNRFRLPCCQAEISPCLLNSLFLKLCHPHSSLGSTTLSLRSSSHFGIVISLRHPIGGILHTCLGSFSYQYISQGTFGESVAIFYLRRCCNSLQLAPAPIKVSAKLGTGASGLLSLAQLHCFSEGRQLSQQQHVSVTTATLTLEVLLEK